MPFSVGFIADAHYADRSPAGTRHYRAAAAKLADAIGCLQAYGAELLIELGDFKDQNEAEDPAQALAYLRRIEEVFRQFPGPRHHVLGNHDMDCLSKEQFLGAIANTGFARAQAHYWFDYCGVRLVVLDANHNADESAYDRGNFDWRVARIPSAQLAWLEQTLAGAAGPAVILVHQQLDGGGDHEVQNSGAVREILERSGRVCAVLQGHNHAGDFRRINGIPYYTLPGLIEGSDAIPCALATMSARGELRVDRLDAAAMPRGGR